MADSFNIINHISRILTHRIIHRAFVITAGTVIVDTEPPTHIHQLHGEAHFLDFTVEACGFYCGFFYGLNIGHLRTDVEMNEA